MSPPAPSPKPTATPAASTSDGLYYVIGAGVCYSDTSVDPSVPALGLQHRVIELNDTEADRLIRLGCVRAADEADLVHEDEVRARIDSMALENARGPSTNPFGGQVVAGQTLKAHADEQIALAKKARG